MPKRKTSFEIIMVKELGHTALLGYLSLRGINSTIAKSHCVEIHYRRNGKNYFAIGFKNDAGGYELRNPYFKGCIAPKAITTITNHNVECHVFEGFIDYLSFLVLYGECDAVVLNSIVNIPRALLILNRYSKVYCHWIMMKRGEQLHKDNCSVGEKCADAANEYGGDKDFNEYLMGKSTLT